MQTRSQEQMVRFGQNHHPWQQKDGRGSAQRHSPPRTRSRRPGFTVLPFCVLTNPCYPRPGSHFPPSQSLPVCAGRGYLAGGALTTHPRPRWPRWRLSPHRCHHLASGVGGAAILKLGLSQPPATARAAASAPPAATVPPPPPPPPPPAAEGSHVALPTAHAQYTGRSEARGAGRAARGDVNAQPRTGQAAPRRRAAAAPPDGRGPPSPARTASRPTNPPPPPLPSQPLRSHHVCASRGEARDESRTPARW